MKESEKMVNEITNETNNSIIKLIFQMKENIKFSDTPSINVFIGAGCSLASTKDDISTYGILKSICEKHSHNTSDDWNYIYQKFVNEIWDGQGEHDRINLLNRYFIDCKPSPGYIYLRKLIDLGCIKNIITTNFDLLIDEILSGLSYKLQVGDHVEIIGDDPKFTVIKAHGDLRYGNIRFSPIDLLNLPPHISQPIREISYGILIVIGCRGQDNGIIQALNSSNDHCAYWVSPVKPDEINKYDNAPLYKWMHSRNSDNNFIYGQYGDFNTLIPYLYKQVIRKEKENNMIFPIYKNTYIYHCITFNKYIYNLFESLDKIICKVTSKYKWIPNYPYFSNSQNSLYSEINKILIDKKYENKLSLYITNEIEGILFAICLNIYINMCSCNVEINDFMNMISYEYSLLNSSIKVTDDFWNVLITLINSLQDSKNLNMNNKKLSIILNYNDKLVLTLENVKIFNIFKCLSLTKLYLLFSHTSCETENPLNIIKKSMENSFHHSVIDDSEVVIYLTNLTLSDIKLIKDNFLNDCFEEQKIGNKKYLYNEYTNLYIEIDIKKNYNQKSFGIYDDLLNYSTQLMKENFQLDNLDKIIRLQMFDRLDDFVNSLNPLFILVGKSGSGKSTLLKYWSQTTTLNNLIILPLLGKNHSFNVMWLGNIQYLFENKNSINEINEILELRNEKIVIIFDGLNEVKLDYNYIIDLFNIQKKFTETLLENNITNIKLIISMRDDFYSILKEEIDFVTPSAIYYPNVSHAISDNIHIMNKLSNDEISQLVSNKVNYSFQEKIIEILNTYQNSITPLLVELFIRNYLSENINNKERNMFLDVEKKWINSIINNGSLADIDIRNHILNTIIDLTFFNQVEKSIYLQDILNSITTHSYTDIVNNLNYLKDSSLLQIDNTVIDIKYDHITEYLLTEILLHQNLEMNELIKFIQGNYNKSIMIQPLQLFFSYLIKENLFKLSEIIKQIFVIGDNYIELFLTKCIIKACNQNNLDFLNNMMIMIKMLLQENCFHQFVKKILLIYNQYCLNKEYLSNAILLSLSSIISNEDKCYYKYINSLYIFTFLNIVNNTYEDSFRYIEEAENYINDKTPNSLIDEICELKAKLLRQKGMLPQAVEILEAILDHKKSLNQYNEYCQTALELGAIMREETLFDETLELYNSIPIDKVTDLHLKYAVTNNKGIIIKNKLQILLYDNLYNPNDDKHLYYEAYELFSQSYDFVNDYSHIPFKLEVLCEMIEISEIGYRLGFNDLQQGENYVEIMKEDLAKYPVPVRLIQACRMEARISALKEDKFVYTLSLLRKGKDIALKYNIPFRVADCCNQIASLVCSNLDKNISKSIIDEAIQCTEYSINYYRTLNIPNHKYLLHELERKRILEEYISQ